MYFRRDAHTRYLSAVVNNITSIIGGYIGRKERGWSRTLSSCSDTRGNLATAGINNVRQDNGQPKHPRSRDTPGGIRWDLIVLAFLSRKELIKIARLIKIPLIGRVLRARSLAGRVESWAVNFHSRLKSPTDSDERAGTAVDSRRENYRSIHRQ